MTIGSPESGGPAARLPDAYFAVPCNRFGPSTIRAAWWTWMAWRATHGLLPVDGIRTVVPPPPGLPAGATRGVQSVLRRVRATCLERSLVLQAWLLGCGEPYDVIVGVAANEDVQAHAWLPFETGEETSRFKEMIRIPALRV